MKEKPVFSVVVPMFNEEESLPVLYHGSSDRTAELIREHAEKDKRVRPVIFARNFGQQSAVKAGLDFTRGDAVVVIDADLQDPPEVIHQLIEKWREGYELVYAQRTVREGETFFKKLTARMFYRLIQRITDIDLPLDTGFFRLLDRKVVDEINALTEHHRFFRGLSIWVGYKQIAVPYKREARYAGETKYPLRKMLQLAMTAITGFSFFPLQAATYLGFISSGIAIVVIPIVIVMRLIGNQAFLGQASTLIAVLFLGGVQLISLGILGEYIGRIYDEVRGRPLYIVREKPED
jgi:dolichol-phosphate mannosyltransferase